MITALVSRKGGVGKTTTSVNLGAALAEKGKRVLLVDLDPQSSASLSLGVPREQLAPSSADVLLGGVPAAEVIRPTSIDGLSLITASTDLQRADSELSVFSKKEGRLKAALAPLTDRYDHILLDCPSSLSLLPVNALVASNAFIVPASPQYLAVTGVANLIAAADRLAWNSGGRTLPLGILMTMVDYRTKLTRRTVDRIRAEHGPLVFAIEIRINIRLAEAPEMGQTIFQYDPSATGAEAYRLLADEYLLRAGVIERAGRPD
ncbi:MAG TPA: ParA family protein [Thermoanaerobaculia bacterium]|nr:ParA family protein [Thermoanaerobaculia bacterium]